jgi:hypothetical protein
VVVGTLPVGPPANELISSDLGFVGIVEETEGQEWVVVWNPEHDIIGAESGEWKRYFGRLQVSGETLPKDERSFVGYAAYTKKARRAEADFEESFVGAGCPGLVSLFSEN